MRNNRRKPLKSYKIETSEKTVLFAGLSVGAIYVWNIFDSILFNKAIDNYDFYGYNNRPIKLNITANDGIKSDIGILLSLNYQF